MGIMILGHYLIDNNYSVATKDLQYAAHDRQLQVNKFMLTELCHDISSHMMTTRLCNLVVRCAL